MSNRNQRLRTRQAATLAAVALVIGVLAGVARAQRPVGRNFEQNAPAVGDAIPDVVVYDRVGDEHRLGNLLGERYTVLILGCLT